MTTFRQSFSLPLLTLSMGAALLSGSALAADGVTLTTGAGYIPMVKAVSEVCRQQVKAPITESYGGNIGQMLAQVAQGSGVNVVISDAGTLKMINSPVKFAKTQALGSTPLVLVWRKGVTITSPDDLATDKVKAIATPDSRAAVYGRVAKGWLEGQPSEKRLLLEKKWMEVGHVPQVIAYVLRGEVDAGFVNVVASNKNRAELGGVMPLKDGYPPIDMVATVVAGHENDAAVNDFLQCLASPEAKSVFAKFGVKLEK